MMNVGLIGHNRTTGGAGARRPLLFLALLAAATVAVLDSAPVSYAATIQVSTTEQLQAALNSAGGGDTIALASGIYAPDAPLDLKANVSLVGPDVQAPLGQTPGAIISGGNIDGSPADVITVDGGVSATLDNVAVRLASRDGRAIVVNGTLTLANAELSQNNSDAAIWVGVDGQLAATNVTIAGNSGGAADIFGKADFVNSTIADNNSAGIYNEPDSDVSITNTLVVRNGNGTKYSSDCYQGVDSVNSLDDDGTCNANLRGNAGLGPLGYNGGPTQTMPLLAGSPAIDAGIQSACPARDQRFAVRSGACDIGAYEYGVDPPARATVNNSSASGAAQGAPSTSNNTASSGQKPSGAAGSTAGHATQPHGGAGSSKTTDATIAAKGKVKASSGRQGTFQVRGTAGRHTGLVVFNDPVAKLRLRATSIAGITFDRAGHIATLRGTGVNELSGRHVVFRVNVSSGGRKAFGITLSNGYSLAGRIVGGTISMTT
jgi:hypothetical protein